MLELMGTIALNYLDLQRNFSLLDICRQQEAFFRFAKVHCLPVKSRCWARKTALENGYGEAKPLFFGAYCQDEANRCYRPAQYLTKDFWLWLFGVSMDGREADDLWEDIRKSCPKNWVAIVWELMRRSPEFLNAGAEKLEKLEKEFPEEWYDSWLDEQAAGVTSFLQKKEARDARQFCMLLAAVQLAEQDAARITVQEDREEPLQDQVLPFVGQDGAARLEAGKAYRLTLYGTDDLPSGTEIRTVQISVEMAKNAYLTAQIHLCSEEGEPVGPPVTLEQGVALYCTMADDRLVGFLPVVSRLPRRALGRADARDWSLYRTAGSGTLIKVIPGGDGRRISSFALDPSDPATSFLYLEDGKLCTDCYEKYQDDYALKAELLAIKYLRYAEVGFTEKGCYLLLDVNGSIHSNDPAWDRKQAITLSGTERTAFPRFLDARRQGTQ